MELSAGISVTCAEIRRQETLRRSRQSGCKITSVDTDDPMILPRIIESRKSCLANISSLMLLMGYAVIGGFVFLYLEEADYNKRKHDDLNERYNCIDNVIRSKPYDASTALTIIQQCIPAEKTVKWDFLNALLYGFGIITTLGYGKIQPSTKSGRIFTVIYGCIGVPTTVIILTNFGLYLRRLEKTIRLSCLRSLSNRWRSKTQPKDALRLNDSENESDREHVSPRFLVVAVICYLTFGAIVMPLLNGKFEFVNGLYFSYICFTAIEFGGLIPETRVFIPIVICYMCVGLSISTMAVEVGAIYFKRLYYFGRRSSNFAAVKIWFGSKQIQVTELLRALSETIGISPDTFSELDLEQLVKDAIMVKEGKLDRIPQCYIFLEGIWPPALVPLFMRDGSFPDFVDADDKQRSSMMRKKSLALYSIRNLMRDDSNREVNNNALVSKISTHTDRLI